MTGTQQNAPAKFNLWLHIVGRRDDGFHLIDSLVAFADFGDALTCQPADDWSLALTGPESTALTAEGQGDGGISTNLVLRAAKAFHQAYGGDRFSFTLDKHLPIASGIGGGSADAAACLRLLAQARGVDTDTDDFQKLCLGLGADVPMCLASTAACISGIGETVTPVSGLESLFIVAVNPRQPVSTPEVFASYKMLQTSGNSGDNHTASSGKPQPKSAEGWLAEIGQKTNDLQPAASALCPEISNIEAQIAAQNGCNIARMSGSGATVFGLFQNQQDANEARKNLSAKWPDWWVKSGELF